MAARLIDRCIRCEHVDGLLIELNAVIKSFDKTIEAISKREATITGPEIEQVKWDAITAILCRRYCVENGCSCLYSKE